MDYYQGLTFLFGNSKNQPNTGLIHLFGRQYYCLQYNHGGIETIQMGSDAPVTATGPCVLLTYPGEDFIFGCQPGSTWLHNAMAFKGPLVEELIAHGLFPINRRPPVYPIRDAAAFYEQFSQCCHFINQGERFHHHAAHALIGLLLQLYDETRAPASGGGLAQRLSVLTRAITSNPSADWNFPEEAGKLHISYAHLRRMFKQATGSSPQKYLQQCRLTMASELLLNSNIPIKEVANSVGIPDLQYFTRIFRQQYQVPPGQFRTGHGITTIDTKPGQSHSKR